MLRPSSRPAASRLPADAGGRELADAVGGGWPGQGVIAIALTMPPILIGWPAVLVAVEIGVTA
jgi:hypothetical protein